MISDLLGTRAPKPHVAPTKPTPQTEPPQPKRIWGWVKLAVFAVLGFIAYSYLPWDKFLPDLVNRARDLVTRPEAPAQVPAQRRVVPVRVAVAERGNLDLYLNGLGSVTS